MPAYIVYKATVTDFEAYKEYMKRSPAVLEKFGAKFLTRGGRMATLEGEEETRRVILIEFPSYEQALAYYNSPDYQAIIPYREGAAEAQFVLLEGVDDGGNS